MPRIQAHGKYKIILNKVQEHVMPTMQNNPEYGCQTINRD